LFALQPHRAVINDVSHELINCYIVIRDHVDELISDLTRHGNNAAYYYHIRDLDRTAEFPSLSPILRASRTIYLNKTCYNGLFRVNSRGEFNVPFGRYQNPRILDEPLLRAISRYLRQNAITMTSLDFAEALQNTKAGDFVYLDPPYDPVSATASFTSYSLPQFNRSEQIRLKEVFAHLTSKGVYALLSNSATPFILDLYREYDPVIVAAGRAINSNAAGRGKTNEVLVCNYAFLKS